MSQFPDLPIVTPDGPRKTQGEKYGGLLYLGVGGLIILIAMLLWFGLGVWQLRSVWTEIYRLNDPSIAEPERMDAARHLAQDPRVTERQKWDLALSRVPPDAARYLIAESMTSELAASSPREYAIAVARSEGWPEWLRLLLARPLAMAAGEGSQIDESSVLELSREGNTLMTLLCDYTLAVAPNTSDEVRKQSLSRLETAAKSTEAAFAGELLQALRTVQPSRAEHFRAATRLIRTLQPGAPRLPSS